MSTWRALSTADLDAIRAATPPPPPPYWRPARAGEVVGMALAAELVTTTAAPPPPPAPSMDRVDGDAPEATPADDGAALDGELRRLHGAGLSLRAIAAALGGRLSKSGVALALKRLGLSTAPPGAPGEPSTETAPATPAEQGGQQDPPAGQGEACRSPVHGADPR